MPTLPAFAGDDDEDRTVEFAGFPTANAAGYVLAFGEFDLNMKNHALQQVQTAVSAALDMHLDHVTILMDSYGGYSETADRYISAMQLFRPSADFRYIGYVLTRAMSACFRLLQHCDWRVAHPTSLLLTHFGEQTVYDRDQPLHRHGASVALEHQLQRTRQDVSRSSRRSGQAADRIHRLQDADRLILPQQALELGLLDEIIEPLPIRSFRPNFLLRVCH